MIISTSKRKSITTPGSDSRAGNNHFPGCSRGYSAPPDFLRHKQKYSRYSCSSLPQRVLLPHRKSDRYTTVARQKSERDTFTEADIAAIKKSTLPAADIALILISCGCRPGELFTVPLDNCWDDHFIGGSKTQAGKNRVIPIGTDGLEAYRRIRAKAIEDGEKLLIGGYSGQNKTAPNYTKRDWRELMESLGIEGMTPYNCRHTFITRAIRSGMDLPKLEAIVGHVDRETTKIYTHLHANDLVEAVQSVKPTSLAVVNKLSTRSDTEKLSTAKSS